MAGKQPFSELFNFFFVDGHYFDKGRSVCERRKIATAPKAASAIFSQLAPESTVVRIAVATAIAPNQTDLLKYHFFDIFSTPRALLSPLL